MAVRPDPEVGYRRPGDHRRADGLVERRVFVQAAPRTVWADAPRPIGHRGHLPGASAGSARRRPGRPRPPRARARTRLGLLREIVRVESLEARPEATFRLRVTGSGFESEWNWRLEPVAGGTRVIHAAMFEPIDRWTSILVRFGRASLASRVETHLRALKERAELAERTSNPAA